MGAVLTPPALFLGLLVLNPRLDGPEEVFDTLLAAVAVGPLFGLFFGAVGGWIWLVVTVGREASHAARKPPDAPPDVEEGQLPPNSHQGDRDA